MSDEVRTPYPGLRSFRHAETELFFGRDGCINAMVDRLSATHFLAVLGSSGTGKSSLVKAGLLDALELGLMVQAGSRWSIADFRPEHAPLTNLARRLLALQDPPVAETETDVNLLRAFIARGPRSIIEWCRAGNLKQGHSLLLLVDQFEELFRYSDYAGREEAEAFVALLIESARSKEFPIYIAITMRSEYLGACALIDGLAEEINAGLYLTPRMTREECEAAIVGPAKVCDIDIDDALVNRLLNDLASFAPWEQGEVRESKTTQLDRLIRRADQLPLLQYTLNRMWLLARERDGAAARVRLGLADYKGLSFALNDHADQIFHKLDADKRPVEKVFRALTSGTTIADAVRQPTRLEQLVAICEGDEEGVRAVVEAYRAPGCNFLLPEVDPLKPLGAATVIDISHESLIRQWTRLSGWLAKEASAAQQWRRLIDRFNVGVLLAGRELANFIAWRNELKPNAAWASRYGGDYPSANAFLDRSEQAQRRRYLIRSGAAAAVFAILFAAAAFSFFQWRIATRSLAEAELHRARAQSNYLVARGVLANLAEIVERVTGVMQVSEVSELFISATNTLNRIVKDNADDAELAFLYARVLDTFADAYRSAGAYHTLALNVAKDANALFRRLADGDKQNTTWSRYLALNLDKIGDLQLKLNDGDDARKSYEEALGIERSLAQREPDREDHPRQIATELFKLGMMDRGAKNFGAAATRYEEALDLRRKLAERFALLPLYLRDLSLLLREIADFKGSQNDPKGALAANEEAIAADRRVLTTMFGSDRSDKENVAIGLGRVGALQLKLGDRAAARKTFDQRLAADRDAASSDPSFLPVQLRIADSLRQIAELQLDAGDVAAASKSYADAFAADRSATDVALFDYRRDRSNANKESLISSYGLATWSGTLAGDPAAAARFAENILKFNSSPIWIQFNLAHAYLLLGRYDDAKAIYLDKLGKMTADGKASWLGVIKDDFRLLRRLKLGVNEVDRMAKELGIAEN